SWDELRLVLAHKNPYRASYPPFTFPANILFMWPPWPAARFYFALLNLICLGLVAAWAYRVVAWRDRAFAVAIAVSVPATSAVSTAMGLGVEHTLRCSLLSSCCIGRGGWLRRDSY